MTTLDKLKAWLADDANVVRKSCDVIVRKRYVTTNGIEISIQQSHVHNCREGQVEMWCCPHDEILEPYCNDCDGEGNHGPYNFVPLEVVAEFIDKLESQT